MKKTTTKQTKTKTQKERFVLVTTEFRGVFAGYATNVDGETIRLRAGRNCVYWSSDVRGFEGLAVSGPSSGCKVGPAADITLRKITAVVECTPQAEEAWGRAPWA